MEQHLLYLLKTRECIRANVNIFKIGKTKQENLKRFRQYRGSVVQLITSCNDCDMLEIELIKKFKLKYIHRKDYGNEYFEGDYEDMKNDINNEITNEKKLDKDDFMLYYNDWPKWFDKNTKLRIQNPSEYNRIENSYKAKNNVLRIEHFNRSEPYMITTYSEFIIHTSINKIVITNKKNQEGQIWQGTDTTSLLINKDNLISLLEQNAPDKFNKDNIWYYTKSSFDTMLSENNKNNEEDSIDTSLPFKYDYKKIIKDICTICFEDEFFPKLEMI